METKSETKITYGLRDSETGKFAYLAIQDNRGKRRDFCGDEMVALTIDPWIDGAPRFEVLSIGELAAMMREDPSWFNSSREYPKWCDLDPSEMEPTRYTTTMTWDIRGGDPISTSTECESIVLPPYFEGKVYPTRENALHSIMQRTFGDAFDAFGPGKLSASISLVDTWEVPIEDGMLFRDRHGRICQVDKIVPVPETWPNEAYSTIDLCDPRYLLVLARNSDFTLPVAPEPESVSTFR